MPTIFFVNKKQHKDMHKKHASILLQRIFFIMRLTGVIISMICLFTFSLYASPSDAQDKLQKKITLSLKNVSVKEVFDRLGSLSAQSITFSGNPSVVSEKINISVKNKTIEQVLRNILSSRNLTYTIVNDRIIIHSGKLNVRPEDSPKQQLTIGSEDTRGNLTVPMVNLTGQVVNDKGEPLGGVSVILKDSKRGTSSIDDGTFSFKNVPIGGVLIFSCKNYVDYTYTITEVNKNVRIVLQDAVDSSLANVVVTGYQTIDRRKFTGAATRISGSDVEQPGMVDISRMLEGKVAGVSIQNVSGTFGSAPKFRIRGATSISGDNKPLWIIDGVVQEDLVSISNDQLSSGDPSTLLGSSIAGVNIDDVESIDILKDASATALYGARAMNGVVVVTTKKGKSGDPRVAYTGNFTTQLKPSYSSFDIMNSADQMSVYAEMDRKGWFTYAGTANNKNWGAYGKMYNLINQYDSITGTYGLENTTEAKALFLTRYAKANTDWFDVLFSNNILQNHSISISSGTEKTQSYFSTSYYGDPGWALGNNTKRYTTTYSSVYKLSPRLTVKLNGNAVIREQKAPGTNDRVDDVVAGTYERTFDINPFSYAINTSRTITPYDQNGNLEYFQRNYAPFNILYELQNNNMKINAIDVKSQAEINYKISKSFRLQSIGAYRYVKTTTEKQTKDGANESESYRAMGTTVIMDANSNLYSDPAYPNNLPVSVLPYGGFYNRYENSLRNFYLRNALTYDKSTGRYNINAIIGNEIKYTDRQSAYSNGWGYQYDQGGVAFTDYRAIKELLEANKSYFGMAYNYDRFVAYFANSTVTLDNKYILNATLRYDGSNKMGSSSSARWLPTWTFGGGWNISSEKFMESLSGISNLKLRVSYGLNASMGNANNSSVILNNGLTRRPYVYEKENLITITDLENSELTWEKDYTGNFGFDMGLFKDKISLSVDYYFRNSFDLIDLVNTSGIGGEVSKYANYADMRSNGVDVTLGMKLINKSDWKWNANLVMGYNKSKITRLSGSPRIYDLVIAEGGALKGYPVRGLFAIPFKGLDPLTGEPQFVNESGVTSTKVNLSSTSSQNLKYMGPVDPVVTGGLTNTVSYKQITFSFLLSYQTGNKVRMAPFFKTSYTDWDAMPKSFLNRWGKSGEESTTNIPSIIDVYAENNLVGYPYNIYNYSTEQVADGSFIRLKNVSLTYNVPYNLLKVIKAKTASLTAVGTNIWLIYADKKLNGQDPEFFNSGGVALPMPRSITLSLKLGF